MTGPQAAYVLGYNPYIFRVHEHDGEADTPLKVLRELSFAITRLAADIRPDVLRELRDEVQALEADWVNLQECGPGGWPDEGFLTEADRVRADQRDLVCMLAQESLPPDHPLHALLQFGLALGEYDFMDFYVARDRGHVRDPHRASEQGLPDMSRFVQRAESLPPWLLRSLPEVRRLVTFGPYLRDLGVYAFAQRVLGWMPPSIGRSDPGMVLTYFYNLLDKQVRGGLRQVAEQPATQRPRWDDVGKKLWYGSVMCAHYKHAAPNQMLVLAAFEEERWPAQIDDPLDPAKLANTIKDLQEKLKGSPVVIERDGTGKGICWRPCPPQ
jgi:hypothetical protein